MNQIAGAIGNLFGGSSAKAPDEGRGPPKKRGREKKTPPVVEAAEPEKVVEKPPQDDDETEDEDEGAAAAVKAGRGKRPRTEPGPAEAAGEAAEIEVPKAFDSADDKTKALVKQVGKVLYSPHSLGLAWVVPVGEPGIEGIHKETCRRMFETVFVPVIGIPTGCFRAAAVFGDSAHYKKTAPLIADMLITQSENGAWLPATTDYLVQVLEVLARLKGTDDTDNLDPAKRFGQWEFKDMSAGSDLFELDLIMYKYAIKVLYGCFRHNFFIGGAQAIIKTDDFLASKTSDSASSTKKGIPGQWLVTKILYAMTAHIDKANLFNDDDAWSREDRYASHRRAILKTLAALLDLVSRAIGPAEMAAIFTLEAPNMAVFDARMLVEKYGCPSSNSMATIKAYEQLDRLLSRQYPVDPGAQRSGQSAFEVDGTSHPTLSYSM